MKTMKDIKSYLHLYIGCQHRIRYVDYENGEWTVWSELTADRLARILRDASVSDIQIQLRRLSDMSEEDFKEFSKPKSFDTYGGYWYACDREIDPEFEGDVIEHINEACDADPENVIMCHIKSKTISYGWIEYDERYHGFSTEDEAKWIMFLLSKGFDLFGLIDSGLAIDAKTVNK